jgi:hypothetical protein
MRSAHVKTINVEHLPEPIARAVYAMVEMLKAQMPAENETTARPRQRIEFHRKPGRALTDLRRADIYADVG